MPELKREQVKRYLESVFRTKVRLGDLVRLGETPNERDVKNFGYGKPIRVNYETGQQWRSAVLHTISTGPFGHEGMADRAQILLWEHQAFNRLPQHVRSLDVAGLDPSGKLTSLAEVEELCLLTEYAEGQCYVQDLERLRNTDTLSDEDLDRADALCDYLVEIHGKRAGEPGMYLRRIRELVGHGECIMGLADSFPPDSLLTANALEEIEHRAVAWRWSLKGFTHRLSQVHGDFHPWNILFGQGVDFRVLDRSRGEYGEPADDVSCLTMNYLFFSLQRAGRLEGSLEKLFRRFWDRYLERSGDVEMLKVVGPFFAFRGLVLAHPLWYPDLCATVRRKIGAFIAAVLESGEFDPARVNSYCGE
jgi:Phosphotransferase enzyme family